MTIPKDRRSLFHIVIGRWPIDEQPMRICEFENFDLVTNVTRCLMTSVQLYRGATSSQLWRGDERRGFLDSFNNLGQSAGRLQRDGGYPRLFVWTVGSLELATSSEER